MCVIHYLINTKGLKTGRKKCLVAVDVLENVVVVQRPRPGPELPSVPRDEHALGKVPPGEQALVVVVGMDIIGGILLEGSSKFY